MHLKFKNISILHKFLQKTGEGTVLSSFYEGSITLIPKSDNDITKYKTIPQYFFMTMDAKKSLTIFEQNRKKILLFLFFW